MITRFMVSADFFRHPKTVQLQAKLDDTGVVKLMALWGWVTENMPSGVLIGMSTEAIERAVQWSGQRGLLVATLIEIGWLDVREDGVLIVHDWSVHNDWVAGATSRADVGRMGKLASNYPEIHRKYVSAGIRSIDKPTYEREVREYKAAKERQRREVSESPEGEAADTPQPPNWGRLNYVENPETGKNLAENGPTVRNSADPVAYIKKEDIKTKKDQGVELSNDLLAQSAEEPRDEKKTVSLTQKPEETKTVGELLTGATVRTNPAEPLKKTDIDPKLILAPGEVEEIHPLHVPEGMTVDEVREIRRQRRLEPRHQALPDWLKVKDLRMIPFIEADERRMAQEKREAQAAAQAVETPPVSKKPPLSPAKQAANRLPVEQSALLEGHAFNRTLNEARKLFHEFSGYRAPTTEQARRSEEEWLVTACQRLGRETCVIFSQASSWVRRKNIAVDSARAYLTTWTNRVALERRLIPAGKVWEKQKAGCVA